MEIEAQQKAVAHKHALSQTEASEVAYWTLNKRC